MSRLSLVVVLWLAALPIQAGPWTQFRGPNATGLADGNHPLPAEIGPDVNVLWKTPVPSGHSGPVVHGDRVFVTAIDGKKQLVIGLERKTGKVLWQADVAHKGLEKHHAVGNNAQPTPATDGERVISLFGSTGLVCHDRDGKHLWTLPLGPFKNDFAAGASPIIVGDRIILNQDHDTDSALMAIDKRTGKIIWKTERSEFPRNYATPVIWEVNGKKQIVVAATLRVVGYDFETGKEVWTVHGVARIINMTPVVGPDGILYVAAWSPGGDPSDRIQVAPFDELITKHDANGNRTFEENEVPKGPLKERFTQIDRDKDGHISREEFEVMRRIFHDAKNVMLAVRPGGSGDITQSHVLWTYSKGLPYVPSPLYYRDHLFFVKNGGILSSVEARTGKVVKQDRVFGSANYYASPVAGDGKIYVVSQRGELSILSAEADWKVQSQASFEEEVFATPAIADGQIFLRTAKHLYCFGRK